MIYNTNTKIAHLLENNSATQILTDILPEIVQRAQSNPQALTLSMEQLIRYSGVPQADALLTKINNALQVLNTPENAISPTEAKLIEQFQALEQEAKNHPIPTTPTHHQDAIYPGKPWLDTYGKRIQAHGGAVFYENGTYYWYGENKEYTDGKNGIWTWGIKIYSSRDLCNWTDLGYLIPPDLTDPNSSLFPTKRVDRPHILKCPATGKYVCWIKLSGPEAAFTIWSADKLLGPYEKIENIYNPGGYKAGDFDLICDEETGNGYLYFDADHKSMLCMKLTEDYLHTDIEVAKSYQDLTPPFTREAPALFQAGDKKYMLTSGMTGYVPNRSDSAVSDSWEKSFSPIGNPHIDDSSDASFNSQISKIFRVEGKENLFIAMADRWLPNYLVNQRISDLFTRVIASNYCPDLYQATDAERQEMYAANVLETADTSCADYVWLPLSIQNGTVSLTWKDAWTPEDME